VFVRTLCAVAGGRNGTSMRVAVGSKRRRVFDDATRNAIKVTCIANTTRSTPYRDGRQALLSSKVNALNPGEEYQAIVLAHLRAGRNPAARAPDNSGQYGAKSTMR
jgi:hypothetical protein